LDFNSSGNGVKIPRVFFDSALNEPGNPMKKQVLLIMVLLLLSAAVHTAPERAPKHVVGAETVDVERAKSLHANGVSFVDVRATRLYKRRHIPGAHHLDLRSAFTEKALLELVAKDAPVVLYCSGIKCTRSSGAATRAVAWGFTRVHYFREGMRGWMRAGLPLERSE
jgi:rhodanese-related sulfurtransferase